MKNFIKFAVAFFIFFVLFLVSSFIISTFSSNFNPLINQTLSGTAQASVYNIAFTLVNKVFAACAVIFAIAIIASYFIESHRIEGEEFGTESFDIYRRYK